MWFGFKKSNEPQQPANTFVPHRHKAAHPLGGLNLTIGEESQETQKVAASVFKQIGAKLFSGNFGSLNQISKPIAMSIDMSFLDGIALGNTFGNLLEQCSDLPPQEQIKYITAFKISGLHCNGEYTKMRSPLDPLVGETVQLLKEDGTEFYAESISSDPPIGLYQIMGKNYKIYGVDRLELSLHKTVNSMTGTQNGKQTIIFNNGAVYKITQSPTMELTGLVMGDRILNWQGRMIIEGPGVKSVINFNFNYEGMMSKLTSFFKSQEQAKIYDIVEVDIFEIKTDENGNITENLITQGIGSWLEGILFGDQTFWQVDEAKTKWICAADVLESDTTRRTDLLFMRQQKMEEAQQAKLKLEEQNWKDIETRKRVQ